MKRIKGGLQSQEINVKRGFEKGITNILWIDHGDADALLQIKRLELELAKERQRADFFEGEQNKLLAENTELRRRTEELNARVDLAKRYDASERLAKKEEEVERLKIEVNSLSEERRMVEEHYHKLLNENRGFRTESDSLVRVLFI